MMAAVVEEAEAGAELQSMKGFLSAIRPLPGFRCQVVVNSQAHARMGHELTEVRGGGRVRLSELCGNDQGDRKAEEE